MAFVRVFLRPPWSPWRRVKQAQRSQQPLRRILQLKTCRYAASKPTENEWTLDLDTDTEEADHAPQGEEPRPPHPTTEARHHSVTSRSGRLLFNVGKKLMTADEFVRKAAIANRRSQITLDDTSDFGDTREEGGGWVEWGIGEEGEGEKRETNKKTGLQSMRQTRKFLRGKALVGSRLATPPSSETAELLEGLDRHLSLSAGHREVFSTVPSVLGSGGREVEGRVGELRRLGFTRREVETVMVSFPAVLQVDYQNVYEVCGVLNKCIPGGYMLRGLMARHPFLFLQPVSQIEERVTVLKNICRDPNALGFLLHHFPILLFIPLTPSTLHTITKYTSSLTPTGGGGKGEEEEEGGRGGLGHSWVAKSLYHNLSTRPARMELGPEVKDLVDLLAEFQLDPAPTLIKFPTFFKTTYAHVASLLTVLTGAPLYLDTGAMRTLLVSIPDQLVWTRDAEQLQTHLNQLSSLFPSPKDCCEKVLSYPGLVLPQLDIASWLNSLSSLGFTSCQIALLVTETPNLLLQDREKEFLPRLRLLLSIPEATPPCLVDCSIHSRVRIFSSPVRVLMERLSFVGRCKPELVSGQHMEEIFGSKEREFATFCGKTVEQVHSDTELTGIELKRFKKSSTKNRAKLVSEQPKGHLRENQSFVTSDAASCGTLVGDNGEKSATTKTSETPKNGANSEIIKASKSGKKQQKSSAGDANTLPQRKKRKESLNNEAASRLPKKIFKTATRRERGSERVSSTSRRAVGKGSVTTGVVTEAFTAAAVGELSGQHQTADFPQTLTAATPREEKELRKTTHETHVKTGRTSLSD